MPDLPLVSVVIPTYNQKEHFLRECIESARAQTYTNVRIIISDNHSTNNVPQILQEYAAKDPRVKIIKPPTFLNISDSFLYAISCAEGEYACYVSSDDILMPNCIEELITGVVANKQALFAHGKALYFYPDNTSEERWEYFGGRNGYYEFNKEAAERILKFEYVCFSGCVISTAAWKKLSERVKNANLTIHYSVDILIALLLFETGGLYYSGKILAKVRMENDTRETRLPYMINDAANIWNFIESDEKIKKLLQDTGVDIETYRHRFFMLQSKSLYYPFLENHFGFEGLTAGFKNLKKFGMKAPFYFTASEKMILNFPGFSKLLYKIMRPLLLKLFNK